jgi:hypothetical protein
MLKVAVGPCQVLDEIEIRPRRSICSLVNGGFRVIESTIETTQRNPVRVRIPLLPIGVRFANPIRSVCIPDKRLQEQPRMTFRLPKLIFVRRSKRQVSCI